MVGAHVTAARAIWRAVAAGASRCWGWHAEFALSAAFLGGWALVTAGLAACTTPKIWWFSAGGLLLGLSGVRFVGEMLWKGLYTLTREDRRHG